MDLRTRLNDAIAPRVSFKRVRSRLLRPVASFTFDDFPQSAWTAGGPVLARYGAAATYYVTGALCGVTAEGLRYYEAADLRAVHAAGHEVGCHTYSHWRMPLRGLGELRQDLDRNKDFIREVLEDVVPTNFAYPYGAVSLWTKHLVSNRFATSRGIRSGVNIGSIDLDQLRVVRLERHRWTAREVEESAETACRANGWIVFVSHDISRDPSPYGATPEMLEHALTTVVSSGFEVLPVNHALARVMSS